MPDGDRYNVDTGRSRNQVLSKRMSTATTIVPGPSARRHNSQANSSQAISQHQNENLENASELSELPSPPDFLKPSYPRSKYLSYPNGDTQAFDLAEDSRLEALEREISDDRRKSQDDDELDIIPGIFDPKPESPEVFLRPPPITPNPVGKRKSKETPSNDPSSESKVPHSLIKKLATNDDLGMSLSQAFGGTQNNDTPRFPKSDPVFDRPSPEVINRFTSPTSPLFTHPISEGLDFNLDSAIKHREREQSIEIEGSQDMPQVTQVDNNEPEILESHTKLGSQIDIQVPRSSKPRRLNEVANHSLPTASPIGSKIHATPINQNLNAIVEEPFEFQDFSDRIMDSQLESTSGRTQPKGFPMLQSALRNNVNEEIKQLPLTKDDQILGPRTQAALITSTPPHPPKSSPPKRSSPSKSLPTAKEGSSKRDYGNLEDMDVNVQNSAGASESQTSGIISRKRVKILTDIEAEPSQKHLQQMSFDLSIQDDLTEEDKAYNEMFRPSSSGSSPVNRRSRPKQQLSSLKSFENPNDDSDESSNEKYDSSKSRSSISLNDCHDEDLPETLPRSSHIEAPPNVKSQLRNSRQKTKASKARPRPNHDIFEFEDTQPSAPSHNTTQVSNDTNSPDDSLITDVSNAKIRFPDRVFTFWPTYDGYYPATCLGVQLSTDGTQKLSICSDEGDQTLIDPKSAYNLQLKPGDQIRVDLPELKRKWFVVVGFKGLHKTTEPDDSRPAAKSPHTDVYGHEIVTVAAKGRDSMPGSTNLSNTIDVSISKVKLARSRVAEFEDRKYVTPMAQNKLHTLSRSRSSTPLQQSRTVDQTPVQTTGYGAKLFQNMAFAISVNSSEARTRITTKVVSNSGQIIAQDFAELFASTSLPQETEFQQSLESLKLTSATESLGFTALIANDHSRKPKYMQALALNLPILHYRWIDDCVAANKILSWRAYLLPAGKSSFLFDTVRSRILMPYNAAGEKAALKAVLKRREKLFSDKKVLFIKPRSNQVDEKIKSCTFLLAALGAERIGFAANLTEAKNKLIQESWDYIYVNDDDRKKKSFDLTAIENEQVLAHETIIQSLILGELFTSHEQDI